MNTISIHRADIEKTLSRMRDISAQFDSIHAKKIDTPSTQFESLIGKVKGALTDVNKTQIQADNLRESYLRGDPKISVSHVMLSSVKSKIALEGLIAVRNKLLESYREIMNMPV